MRILFTGGGTGGHIYPALAMAEILKERYPLAEIQFLGGTGGIEEALVSHAGYPIHTIPVEGLKRKLTIENLRVIYRLGISLFASRKYLRDYRPDIVIGTGGYVCYPVVRMAAALGIPTALHESNATPGLAVKLLARHVNRIWLGMEDAQDYLRHKDKICVMGNPLRKNFTQTLYAKANARQKYGIRQREFFVLSFGGSLGAKTINDCMYEIICKDTDKDIRYCHICGKKYQGLYDTGKIPKRHRWLAYTEDMPHLIEAADLVIARAGAMTLAEISACRKAAILVPSPNVAKNHQYHNAKALADKGAAMLQTEAELSPAGLKEKIDCIKDNPQMAQEMQIALHHHFSKDTKAIFLEEIAALCKKEF